MTDVEIPEEPDNLDYIIDQRLGPALGPYFKQLVSLLIDHLTDREQHINTAKVTEDVETGTESEGANQGLSGPEPGERPERHATGSSAQASEL